jgi:hydroxymethylpyrimidine pyrophosphatase-like HAD family hydrolase
MQMTIAVDFDGTVVKHKYPAVGETVDGAVETLKRIVEKGNRIILWTMRHGKELDDAVKWYEENGIPLFGINSNSEQSSWTESPKAYAQVYIDDAAIGCPMKFDGQMNWHVDWQRVTELLELMKAI